MFGPWITDLKKKASITLVEVMKKSYDTLQQKWRQAD